MKHLFKTNPNPTKVEKTPDEYDVFISYRRLDGARIAKRLRERLLNYKLPPHFKDRQRKLTVYLDEQYEKAAEDFFEETIKPALRRSKALIVVQTPAASLPRSDGGENWAAQEVRYFRSLPGNRPVWVARGMGTIDAALPAELHRELPNVERVDVRGLSNFIGFLSEHELVKFLGPIYDIDDMPRLRREEERRAHSRRMRFLTVVSLLMATFLVLAVLASYGWITAEQQARRQKSLRLAGEAANAPAGEVDLALLLAAEALRTEATEESVERSVESSVIMPN